MTAQDAGARQSILCCDSNDEMSLDLVSSLSLHLSMLLSETPWLKIQNNGPASRLLLFTCVRLILRVLPESLVLGNHLVLAAVSGDIVDACSLDRRNQLLRQDALDLRGVDTWHVPLKSLVPRDPAL